MIEVLKPGFYSSIQDLGRYGMQQYGVPVSGAMDAVSAEMANQTLGNSQNAAVLEMTMTGPDLLFKSNTAICIFGADLSPMVNDKSITLNQSVEIHSGDVLSFGRLNYGFRAYLSVLGGFQTDVKLGSRSMYAHITNQIRIKKQDILNVNSNLKLKDKHYAKIKVDAAHFENPYITVFKGPEYDQLTLKQQQLLRKPFTIAKENNRMAYQLEEEIPNTILPIITSLVMPGTVQLTPSGKLIVLMRDCQTSGGYPRVLQLTEKAINRLAQKRQGDKIQLELVVM